MPRPPRRADELRLSSTQRTRGSEGCGTADRHPRAVSDRAAAGPTLHPARILVADDSAVTRQLIRRALDQEGVEVDEAETGEEAIAAVLARRPDVVLLDISMPQMDGFAVLARLRKTSTLPVILLTARGAEDDRIRGLDLGADDYVVKPFSPGELAARVRSVLRRARADGPVGVLKFQGLRIDLAARDVAVRGVRVALTPKEFDLLATLAGAPRQAFSRAQLLRQVWGSQEAWQTPATVTEHVRRLRSKIEADADHPRWIQTVRRVGYRFEPDPSATDADGAS